MALAVRGAVADVARSVLTAGVITALVVLILGAAALVYDEYNRRERRLAEEHDAAAKAESERIAEARAAKQRRAVLDLLDPGPLPMLCPVRGDSIGRQLVEVSTDHAGRLMRPCFSISGGCTEASVPFHNCTPATQLERAAWDRAFAAAPPPNKMAAARRAVIGVEAKPRVQLLDTKTGQIYSVDRAELDAALRAEPAYVPATPAQVAAWNSTP